VCWIIWHHQRKGFDQLETDVQEYNRAAVSIAENLGIIINDLYQIVMDAGRDQPPVPDGVHFSPQGSSLLGKAVSNVVSPYLT
jgi:lysophospholipase L1-like esterase